MKRLILFLAILSSQISFSQEKDPVVIEINGEEIRRSEFYRIYLKNNDDPKYDKESLQEYADMFINYKLKVQEALHQGYDTIPNLRREMNKYRDQLAQPYLTDTSMMSKLVEEAYERLKWEVRASHILVRVAPDASPEDTLQAYKRIQDMHERITKGGEDFAQVAMTSSEDPSAKANKGDLGYFTALTMVYPFEDMVYSTPVGKVSKPVRTRFGYHLVKVTDKIAQRGQIRVAHIMIVKPNANNTLDTKKDNSHDQIMEIHEALKNGEDFGELARQFSQDPHTRNNGGALPAFGMLTKGKRYDTDFESRAYGLQNIGDFSQPFESQAGWHILRLLEKNPLGELEDVRSEIRARVERDDRVRKTRSSFLNNLKQEYGYKGWEKNLKYLKSILDSTIFQAKWKYDGQVKDKPLFSVDGKQMSTNDMIAFLKSHQERQRAENFDVFLANKFDQWVEKTLIEKEKSQLRGKYPSYRHLIQEYEEGILLFEIMSDQVWNRGSSDSAGLASYYEAHKDNFMWKERADVTVYRCKDMDVAKEVTALLTSGDSTLDSKAVKAQVNRSSKLNCRSFEGRFELESKEELKGRDLNEGVNAPYEDGNSVVVVHVHKLLPPQHRTLEDSRGLIITEYQNHVERSWLDELRSKFEVKVNEEALYANPKG